MHIFLSIYVIYLCNLCVVFECARASVAFVCWHTMHIVVVLPFMPIVCALRCGRECVCVYPIYLPKSGARGRPPSTSSEVISYSSYSPPLSLSISFVLSHSLVCHVRSWRTWQKPRVKINYFLNSRILPISRVYYVGWMCVHVCVRVGVFVCARAMHSRENLRQPLPPPSHSLSSHSLSWPTARRRRRRL